MNPTSESGLSTAGIYDLRSACSDFLNRLRTPLIKRDQTLEYLSGLAGVHTLDKKKGLAIMSRLTLVCLLVTLTGCGKDDDYKLKTMIRVLGAEGIAFEGAVGTLGSTSSVTGVTPNEFKLPATDPISAVIQKSTAGDLREIIVECWYNSSSVGKTAKTSVEYGVASVSCS